MNFDALLKELINCNLGDWQEIMEVLRHAKSSVHAIFSTDAIGAIEPYPATMTEHGLYVQPLFAGPKLFFWNDQTHDVNATTNVSFDKTLSIDSNVAQYIRAVMFGSDNNDLLSKVEQLKKAEVANQSGIDWMPFLLENLVHRPDGDQRVLETMAAIKSFDELSVASLGLDPQVRRSLAKAKLQEAESDLKALRDMPYINERQSEAIVARAILLKAFELKLSKLTPQAQLSELIDFQLRELKTYGVLELRVCWAFFCNRMPFFDPFKETSTTWASKAKSMAWDLTFLRHLESLASEKGRGDYLLPSLATADKRFGQMMVTVATTLSVFDRQKGRLRSFAPDEGIFEEVLSNACSSFAHREIAPLRKAQRRFEKNAISVKALESICTQLELQIKGLLGNKIVN